MEKGNQKDLVNDITDISPIGDIGMLCAIIKKTDMRYIIFLLVVFGISCSNKIILIKSDINTIGIKHKITYKGELPNKIEYNTFIGTWKADTLGLENPIRIDIDSIIYDFKNKTILLQRVHDFKEAQIAKNYRKYYFNNDNLLYKSICFDINGEYLSDSISYDNVNKKAIYYDLINKECTELLYDGNGNIILENKRKIGDTSIVESINYTHDSYSDPFLINLSKNEKLFGCFNIKSLGIYWNSFSNPIFCSNNNVLEFRQSYYGKKSVGRYRYEYLNGLPLIRYGGNGVLYYNY